MIDDNARSTIAEWAKNTQAVARVWLFGSRTRGNHRDDSDFDFAIELMPMDSSTDWALADFISDVDEWRAVLAAAVGKAVSIIPVRDDLPMKFDPRVALVWERLTA